MEGVDGSWIVHMSVYLCTRQGQKCTCICIDAKLDNINKSITQQT